MKIKPRKPVKNFARAMEAKLQANDHKGGWDELAPLQMIQRLKQEVQELEDAMFNSKPNSERKGWRSEDDMQKIIDESADVGNFAMFIHHWASGGRE